MQSEMDIDNDQDTNERPEQSVHLAKNLRIIREFHNIATSVSDEEFIKLVPFDKFRKVQWLPLLQRLRETIVEDMESEWNSMLAEENIWEKTQIIEAQKDKFACLSFNRPQWRPVCGEVKSHLRAYDAATLVSQKATLEAKAEEYESRVCRLLKTLPPKRRYLNSLLLDIQNHQKKNKEINKSIDEMLIKHSGVCKRLLGEHMKDSDPRDWSLIE